jgi:glycosyltransferase involved in cell wall biosynthesis/SAM-dependent methyltransferase
MRNKPLISVIIGFLNAEQFIQEAVESVFAQTYDAWELLLIDDGSSDGSTTIARRYAEQYPNRVRYLTHAGHRNHGVSASRNLGIRNATGAYIAFLDADDVWLPYKLERQVTILAAQPEAAMVYGLSQWWYSWTGKPEDRHRDFVHELGIPPNTLIEPPSLLTLFFLEQKAAIPGTSDIIVRREVLERIGGFEEDLRVYNDQSFYAKVGLNAAVFAANECWDRYRQHSNSLCAVVQKEGREYATRLLFLNWLRGYLSDQGANDPEIWRALRNEIWRCRHPSLFRLLHFGLHLGRQANGLLKLIARQSLPRPIRRWLSAQWKGDGYCPPVGWVRFGSLRRVMPISQEFGYDRGLPIDRYYIERFLSAHAADIRGCVLEIGDNTYTRQFGGDRVTRSDVLHIMENNPHTTIVADLTCANHIPSDTFDCVILTQTLQFIYDSRAALQTLYRILKPGGVLLATVPAISQISRYDMEQWGHYWSFTTLSIRRLLEEAFPVAKFKVEAYGNVLAAISFLHGLATHELKQKELDHRDLDYEVVITIRAVKREVIL